MLAVFVIVLGFVTAALIATASAMYQNTDGTIEFSMETPFSVVKGFLLCMFIGPYLVSKNAASLWVKNDISFPVFSICMIIATVWSFCLGILSIQSLIVLNLI